MSPYQISFFLWYLMIISYNLLGHKLSVDCTFLFQHNWTLFSYPSVVRNMSSFEDLAKIIQKEVANGEMKPVTCRSSAKNFCHFSLLWQKNNMLSKYLKPYDIPAEFSLLDILEPGSPTPGMISWQWRKQEVFSPRWVAFEMKATDTGR